MDSDDISMPQRLEILLRTIGEDENLCVVGSSYRHFGADQRVIRVPIKNDDIFFWMPFRGAICHPSVLMRKSCLVEVGGYEGMKFVEDIDLWLKLRNSGYKFLNVEDVLLHYRIHPLQSRGRRASYFALSGLFLRESLLFKRPQFLIGSILSILKGALIGR